MKITMFLTEDAIQFNLDPESNHEKKFMSLLKEYKGQVNIETGADIAMCRGQYIRNFGDTPRITTITIHKENETTSSSNKGSNS